MDRKPEIDRIYAAMKRAAEKALHGTREERSGRFVLDERRDADKPNNATPSHSKFETTKRL